MSRQTPQILLVEEDPLLSEITAFRLGLLGYDVVKVPTAEQAIDRLQHDLPTLMIVDQTLPKMSGIELLNRLSNDVRTSEMPVIFLSTNAELEEVQQAYNAGADEYLVIPYDPTVLEAKVERLASMVEQTA
ncbi:MAG TPA: response regulator [Lacipirellulaceae bacterium]|jgi:DNA-binding response OmpR family regulator